jgi:hypothetical protein
MNSEPLPCATGPQSSESDTTRARVAMVAIEIGQLRKAVERPPRGRARLVHSVRIKRLVALVSVTRCP